MVRRGHEAAAHGRSWQNSYFLDPDAERRFITDGVEIIHKAMGQTPVGWNAYYVRNTSHSFDIPKVSASNTTSMSRALTSGSSSS